MCGTALEYLHEHEHLCQRFFLCLFFSCLTPFLCLPEYFWSCLFCLPLLSFCPSLLCFPPALFVYTFDIFLAYYSQLQFQLPYRLALVEHVIFNSPKISDTLTFPGLIMIMNKMGSGPSVYPDHCNTYTQVLIYEVNIFSVIIY